MTHRPYRVIAVNRGMYFFSVQSLGTMKIYTVLDGKRYSRCHLCENREIPVNRNPAIKSTDKNGKNGKSRRRVVTKSPYNSRGWYRTMSKATAYASAVESLWSQPPPRVYTTVSGGIIETLF